MRQLGWADYAGIMCVHVCEHEARGSREIDRVYLFLFLAGMWKAGLLKLWNTIKLPCGLLEQKNVLCGKTKTDLIFYIGYLFSFNNTTGSHPEIRGAIMIILCYLNHKSLQIDFFLPTLKCWSLYSTVWLHKQALRNSNGACIFVTPAHQHNTWTCR